MRKLLLPLFPKKNNPTSFGNLRPISLCNVVYKLIRVIVGRSRPLLCDYTTPMQSAFLKGRCTSDNAVVLQELMYRMHKSKVKICSIIHKIDLTKVYDNVSWAFLNQFLVEMQIPFPLVKLIMNCVSSMFLSLL